MAAGRKKPTAKRLTNRGRDEIAATLAQEKQGINKPIVLRATTGRQGRRPDLGDVYFRSSWEANVYRYYLWLIERGEIYKIEFEPERFDFPIKRGNNSYLPDFKIWERKGAHPYFLEVKGYWDQKSLVKVKRFRKYYPQYKLEIIDKKRYKEIAKWKRLIPNWE